MAADENGNSRISVSEDKLRAMFTDFKLELFLELQKYATTQALQAVSDNVTHELTEHARRLTVLELWRAAQEGSTNTRRRLSASAFAWATFAAAVVGSVVTLVLIHH